MKVNPDSSASGASFAAGPNYFHKFSEGASADHIKKQAIWLASLTPDQALRFPSFSSGYWSPLYASYSQKNLAASTAGELMVKAPSTHAQLLDIVQDVVMWTSRALHNPRADDTSQTLQLTLSHALSRLRAWQVSPATRDWLDRSHVIIAGRVVRGLQKTLAEVERIIAGSSYGKAEVGKIHGDIHMGNIMVAHGAWWLIDPRGFFQNGKPEFDLYYEWGKLLHEVHAGYSLICSDRITCDLKTQEAAMRSTEPELNLFYGALCERSVAAMDCANIERGVGAIDRRRALLFEGLILLAILPFHQKNPNRALAFACASLLVLDDFLRAHAEANDLFEYNWTLPYLVHGTLSEER